MIPDVKARILRELAELSWQTQILKGANAVIYIGLPSSLGVVDKTDVLVPVPSGYPQTMLDYAFLPPDSPLKGRVPGAVQENVQFGDTDGQESATTPTTVAVALRGTPESMASIRMSMRF